MYANHTDKRIEYRFSIFATWTHRLLVALLRRYGITPYRYHGQRHSTIMIKASEQFILETLLPEFNQLRTILVSYFEEVTRTVVFKAFFDTSNPVQR
jgi:hypothetical protein